MRRRHFILGLTAALGDGGVPAGWFSPAPAADKKRTTPVNLANAERQITDVLEKLGLLTQLERLNARVFGGSVAVLAQGAVPVRLDLLVEEERFKEACQGSRNIFGQGISWWSDRFSCWRENADAAVVFSPLNYRERIGSDLPFGLFRHQRLIFHAQEKRLEDREACLASGSPKLEVSAAAQSHLASGPMVLRDLLLLAGLESALFDLDFGRELRQLRKNLLAEPVASKNEAQILLGQLRQGEQSPVRPWAAFCRACLESAMGISLMDSGSAVFKFAPGDP